MVNPTTQDEKTFLERYNPTDFERPSVAVDVVILTIQNRQLEVVTVKRTEHPFLGSLSLPGGFVGMSESLDAAAARLLKSKAKLEGVFLEQLYTFGSPARDPRMRIIAVAYYALVPPEKLRGIKTQAVQPELRLAFDHDTMLETALERLRGKLEYAPISTELLPERFTLRELQDVHETILGRKLNKDAFRRKILASGQLVPTGVLETGQGFRPAELYTTTQEKRNSMNKNIIKDGAFTIDYVFTRGESQAMIERCEQLGFAAATVNFAAGAQLATGVRNNDRVKFDDLSLAEQLWKRLEAEIPKELEGWNAIRLNEQFAVYRYTPGQRFKRHQDGTVTTGQGDESRFTVLIYLNDDCEGGETIFSDADRSGSRVKFIETAVKPQIGMALLFRHELWHEGAEVQKGVKYVLRTDVIYSKSTSS
jgi:8-oxo-dGTP diphosphatase